MADKLFSSETIDVFHNRADSKIAVVTFSPSNWIGDGKSFWGQSIAEKNGVSAIGVVAKQSNWFPYADMARAIPVIRNSISGSRHVVTYGSSMGGYAALKYANAVGATCTLSFAPQYSISPQDVGQFDRRFLVHFSPELHQDMAVSEAEICRNTFVFYDAGFDPDWRHVEFIRGIAPRVETISIRQSGHTTIEVFAGTQTIARLFEIGISGDAVAMREYAESLRRSSPSCTLNLISKIVRVRGIDLGMRAFERHKHKFTSRQSALFYNGVAGACVAKKNFQLADKMTRTALDLAPNEVSIMQRMSYVQELLGRPRDAVFWAEKALFTVREAKNFLFLGKFHLRMGQKNAARKAFEEGSDFDPLNLELRTELQKLVEAAARRPAA